MTVFGCTPGTSAVSSTLIPPKIAKVYHLSLARIEAGEFLKRLVE